MKRHYDAIVLAHKESNALYIGSLLVLFK